MIAQRDKDALLHTQTTRALIFYWVLVAACAFALTMSAFSLYWATRYAQLGEMTLGELVREWWKEPRLMGSYSGMYLIALEHVRSVFLTLFFGAAGLMQAWLLFQARARNARILAAIG